jgi:hypothetical protein
MLSAVSSLAGTERSKAFVTAASAIVLLLPMWTVPWRVFDGGIAAAAAGFTLHGLLPYRDYWLLYGPLAGWFLAAPTAVLGPSVELTRFVGLLWLAGQAVVVYWLCRRWTTSFAASLLALSSTLLVGSFMGLEFHAWTMAMTLALLAMALRLGGTRPVIAGFIVGLAFLARLDVGAYGLLALLVLPDRRRILIGFGAVVVTTGIALVLLVPITTLTEQLVWYPLVGPRQFRGLSDLGADIPLALALPLTATLAVLPRLAALAGLFYSALERRTDLMALAVFACLCQLQTLGRADATHLAVASTPAIVVIAALLPKSPRYSLVAVGLTASALFATGALGTMASSLQPSDRDVALQRAVSVVRLSTEADDTVLVGLASHRHTIVNSLLAYYLVDRRPGTRWTMYNPGVTNTDSTQSLMARDLEASSTNLLILDVEWAGAFESTNDSRLAGSSILDRYIQDHFQTWCDFGAYRVAKRLAWEPESACPVTGS